MSRSGVVDWWLEAPYTHPHPGMLRGRNVMLRSAPAATLIHLAYVPVFALLGAWPLVVVNLCFSIPIWAFASWQARKGKLLSALVLSQGEVILHALVATLVIGWGAGFHLYGWLVVAMGAVSVANELRRPGFVLSAVALLFWVAEFLVLRNARPTVSVAPLALDTLAVVNFGSVFLNLFANILALSRAADEAELALQRENERSERLLHNILPDAVASRLKNGEEVIADGVAEASVLFADIVGFTRLSAGITPAELVVTLNEVFIRIDALAKAHGLEKIKTIGDAYMVASGVPQPRPDHAEALAAFALELVGALDAFDAGRGVRLQMRIGMHSGPLVAGVIGKSKFAYDLWGDTVNTASRMESHGEPGRVHVSHAVRERLGAGFEFEDRGVIDVKGKGEMRTWFLVRRRDG